MSAKGRSLGSGQFVRRSSFGRPGIGPVGPIVIGGNGPVGGAGGDAGNGGSVAPWEQRDQKAETADNEIALGGGGGGGFETEKF